MTQEKTPVEEWREEFDNKRQGWNTNYPVLRTHSQAVFAAAAKLLLLCGIKRNQPVGILIDEGGWLFSQMIGTVETVIESEGRDVEKYVPEWRGDEEYVDSVLYVPMDLVGHQDIVDGDYFALITINR